MKKLEKVKVEGLTHCEWNPRTPADLAAENPEMRRLTDSIKANGLLQPIGVWGKIIVYGNRRYEATKLAGMEEIDAYVYNGIDEKIARLLTREENENRFGVDPLRDAQLIKSAVERGLSQSEIAAACGVSDATICRRMKLTTLSDKVISALADKKLEARALEMIASWDAKLQEDYAKAKKCDPMAGTVSVCRSYFDYNTATVGADAWMFKAPGGEERYAKCMTCGMCTGCQPELFAIEGEEQDGEPRCMDSACYKRMCKDAESAAIKAEIDKTSGGIDPDGVVRCYGEYQIKEAGAKSKTRKGKNTFAYVALSYNHEVSYLRWGPDPKIAKERDKADADARMLESRRAGEKENKRRELFTSAKEKIVDKHFVQDRSFKGTLEGFDDALKEGLSGKINGALLAELFLELKIPPCDFDESVKFARERAGMLLEGSFGADEQVDVAIELYDQWLWDQLESFDWSDAAHVLKWLCDKVPTIRALITDEEYESVVSFAEEG